MTQGKRPLVFAPCAFNLAETSRMVEIAKAVVRDVSARQIFEVHFISDGRRIRPAFVKGLVDRCVLGFINFGIRHGFLNTVNRAAKRFGVPGYASIFEYWRGDITLVAEPPFFSNATLPRNHFFTGPLVPHDEFPLPGEVAALPRDKPLIYFAMGSFRDAGNRRPPH